MNRFLAALIRVLHSCNEVKGIQTATEWTLDLKPGDVFRLDEYLKGERGYGVVVEVVRGYHGRSSGPDDPWSLIRYR